MPNAVADIFRPFGSGTPIATDIDCNLVADLECGRGGFSGGNYIIWTHFADFSPGVDIRDGCSRSVGFDSITYGDGDKVVILETSYVVVFVVQVNLGSDVAAKRAYLLRHQPHWPGP
jgi:hypothetical protein